MVFRRVVVLMMSCLGIYQPTGPSPPESSEATTADDQTLTSPRIRLSDGRYLAYREMGVPKNKSNYRVIIVHGFGSNKEMNFVVPQELMDQLGIYLLLFDRAGYGESDPNPKRSMKSETSDILELADQLQLGSKFYLISVSLGSYPAWNCLNRVPHRLAGVALVVPFVNYKWPSLPSHLIKDDYRKNLARWMLWVARYTPGLLHWWLTQKLFPSSSVLDRNPAFFCNKDLEVLQNTPGYQLLSRSKLQNQRVFDSLRRDFVVAFGKWDFDPLDLSNPFPQNESRVHIWQGYEDKVVPAHLHRYVSGKLPWIRYHEVADNGHFLVYDRVICEAILRSLLLGEDSPMYSPQLEN